MSYNINRPEVRVWGADGKSVSTVPLPAVFKAPIRHDIVQFVHTNLAKNRRSAYGVSMKAGHQTSAESWGTGRAVARIPRVAGGGTHRAGQGAFGNMCRKGRMFAPTRVWRRWHRKVLIGQRRYAVASALAASGLAPLVQARGHRISNVSEIPLVIDNAAIEVIDKSKKALAFLKLIGADADVSRVKNSKQLRAGKGKIRNRRYRQRRGPLIIHTLSGTPPLLRSFRNHPGVEFNNVHSLNPLVLAPGGHVGRFIIWTKSAFQQLNDIFGNGFSNAKLKADYRLPRSLVTHDDISRIIQSDQVQSRLRLRKGKDHNKHARKVNPLTHKDVLDKLNPYAKVAREASKAHTAKQVAAKEVLRKYRRDKKAGKIDKAGLKAHNKARKTETRKRIAAGREGKKKTRAFRKAIFGYL